MRAVALLSWWQLKNSIRALFTDPRKLVPFLFVAFFLGVSAWITLVAPPEHERPSAGIARFLAVHQEESRAALFIVLAAAALHTLSRGFTGKALVFSLADVDYLFASPISRRIVLAYKLPATMWRQAIGGMAISYFVWLYAWKRMPDGGPDGLHVALLFIGAGAYFATWSNLSVAIESVFGLGRAALGSRILKGAIGGLLLWAAIVAWRNGLGGLMALERNIVFATIFYPCRLMAEVMVAPLVAQPIGGAVIQLVALAAGSVAAALYPRGDYYEATLNASERGARVRQAAREGNILAAWNMRDETRETPVRDFSRPYAVEPFGSGAAAVFWAHVTAMAKRPLINFAGPFAVGSAISIGAMIWLPRIAPMVPLILGGYALLLLASSGWRTIFGPTVARRALIRPLPIAPWRLVAVDIGAAAIPGTLAAMGAGLPLLAGEAVSLLVGALLLVAAPPLLVSVLLAGYTVAFWYPSRSDKASALIASLVMGGGMLLLSSWLALLIVPFVLLRLPYLLIVSIPLGCAVAGAALLPLAARAFAKSEDGP